jgi:hypothetical protein
MPAPDALLERLNAIAASVANTPHALALIGLGSIGTELERLDAYSDLDFFVIVDAGCKRAWIADLAWMEAVAPVAYAFRNTADGYKLLFIDGIFCEFAVFEPADLAQVPFQHSRLVWKRPDIAADSLSGKPVTTPPVHDTAWLVGEALTNLYIGLCRHRRGEKLSAARFIQQYAVDRILELAPSLESEVRAPVDPFAGERRFEQRFPGLARYLPEFVQGYEHNCDSALAILAFLQQHFTLNDAMVTQILNLAREDAND